MLAMVSLNSYEDNKDNLLKKYLESGTNMVTFGQNNEEDSVDKITYF